MPPHPLASCVLSSSRKSLEPHPSSAMGTTTSAAIHQVAYCTVLLSRSRDDGGCPAPYPDDRSHPYHFPTHPRQRDDEPSVRKSAAVCPLHALLPRAYQVCWLDLACLPRRQADANGARAGTANENRELSAGYHERYPHGNRIPTTGMSFVRRECVASRENRRFFTVSSILKMRVVNWRTVPTNFNDDGRRGGLSSEQSIVGSVGQAESCIKKSRQADRQAGRRGGRTQHGRCHRPSVTCALPSHSKESRNGRAYHRPVNPGRIKEGTQQSNGR